jgi:hypothetical protein
VLLLVVVLVLLVVVLLPHSPPALKPSSLPGSRSTNIPPLDLGC